MNQNQRKQRRKEMKARAKASKRAKREVETVAESPSPESPVEQAERLLEAAKADVETVTKGDLTNEEARGMLANAARFLNRVVEIVDRSIESAPACAVAEATAIRNWKPNNPEGSPQQRARRGTNLLVTLMTHGERASGLLQRILKVTNPDLAKLAKAA